MVQRAADLVMALRVTFPNVYVTDKYRGDHEWLWLYGVGALEMDFARKKHVKSGRHVWLWDLGYFDRKNHMRCSVDHDHPQHWLAQAALDGTRWAALKLPLREDYQRDGPIILIGLGMKSRLYLHEHEWERLRYLTLRKRFPHHEIIYRPKPGSGPPVELGCRVDEHSPIERLLKGASLVVCRHSNVACDAAVAGVPFECEDGAAVWLQSRPYTVDNRLEFLQRLAWWQWKNSELEQAWDFVSHLVTPQLQEAS